MPKYIGPYDAIQPDGDGTKVYHPGDSVTVSASRLDQLRSVEHYRFEDDPPEVVSPAHAQTSGHLVINPVNEQGVSETLQEDKSKKS